jgi:DNA-binding MltR family transcriptional regulator
MQELFDFSIVEDKIINGCENPLNIKIGNYIRFNEEPDIEQIDFFLNSISKSNQYKDYFYVDYHLSGSCDVLDQVVDLRLRLIFKDGTIHSQLLRLFEKKSWDQNIRSKVNNRAGEFCVSHDDVGDPLICPRKYWRTELDPALTTINSLSQSEKSKSVLIREEITLTCWEFYRQADNFFGNEVIEILYVELNHTTKNCSLLRGSCIELAQVMID